MIYKFKSKAAGDVIMLGPNGDEVLRLIGREPAPQGIIEAGAAAAAIQALEAAVAAEEAKAQGAADDEAAPKGISLRQRVWPMVDLLKRAQGEGQPVVWGV
jgi:hypothetical protein